MITKLILHRYKRFMLNNITTLEYTPEKTIQLIAGTNGAGKSSLLYECSLLPADINKDFQQNGYKEVHAKIDGDVYVVTSGKIGPTKHEFYFNGENLNKGGTKKVQLELCKEYLNVTPNIHKVLTNIKNFTDMSVAERRTWLTDISTIDYKYSLNVFKKVQTRYRDIVGGIKLLDNKITTIESKILDSVILDNYKKELVLLEELLELQYKEIDNSTYVVLNKETLSILNNTIERELHQYDKLKTNLNKDVLLYRRDTLRKSIDDTLEILSDVQDKDSNNKDKLIGEIKELNDILLSYDVKDKDLEKLPFKDLFNRHYTAIQKHIGNITEFVNYDLPVDIVDQENFIDTLNKKIKKLKDEEAALVIKYNHLRELKENDDIECPKCSYVWKDGFDELELKHTEDRLKQVRSYIYELDINLKSKHAKLENDKCVLDSVRTFNSFIVSIGLGDFLSSIIGAYTLPREISMLSSELEMLIHKLDEVERYSNILSELKKKEDLLLELNKLEELSKDINLKSEEELKFTLDKLYRELRECENSIERVTKFNKLEESLVDNTQKLKKILDNYDDYLKSDIRIIQNNYIDKHIDYVKGEIRKLRLLIDDSEYTSRSLDGLKRDKQSYEKERDELLILIQTLSPSEGLIAESIMSFVGVFVNRINDVISKIWTYDMELLIPNTEDGDLDYKFGVAVESNDPIEDMGLVSSGMKEIINLSHRLIVMNVLGLDDYAVYLDEFGSKFDPIHRDKTIDIIKDLATSFNQIFIVSHQQEIFSIFKDCDINIISGDNLFMDDIKEYNKKIKIT